MYIYTYLTASAILTQREIVTGRVLTTPFRMHKQTITIRLKRGDTRRELERIENLERGGEGRRKKDNEIILLEGVQVARSSLERWICSSFLFSSFGARIARIRIGVGSLPGETR